MKEFYPTTMFWSFFNKHQISISHELILPYYHVLKLFDKHQILYNHQWILHHFPHRMFAPPHNHRLNDHRSSGRTRSCRPREKTSSSNYTLLTFSFAGFNPPTASTKTMGGFPPVSTKWSSYKTYPASAFFSLFSLFSCRSRPERFHFRLVWLIFNKKNM